MQNGSTYLVQSITLIKQILQDPEPPRVLAVFVKVQPVSGNADESITITAALCMIVRSGVSLQPFLRKLICTGLVMVLLAIAELPLHLQIKSLQYEFLRLFKICGQDCDL